MKYVINGQLTDADQAVLGVRDLALLRGYGIFDYFLFDRYQPLFLEDYLRRFYRSAQLMHLEVPVAAEELESQILDLIRTNEFVRGGLRLVLTGGYSTDGYTPEAGNLMIMQYPWPEHPPQCYTQGVRLLTHRYQREVPEVKTLNYMTGIRMLPKLRKAGAKELLYFQDDRITESTRSNFFVVMKDGTLVTPGEDILLGITRQEILALAQPLTRVEVRDLHLHELANIEEAFLTGSTKKVMPVVQINGLQIGTGRPGPFTREMMQAFAQHCTRYAEEGGRSVRMV